MADEIRLDVSANTTPMERDIADARRRVGTITLNANMDSRGMENFNRSLGKITGQADEFSKSMEAANARVLAFGASVGVINAISNAFKNLVTSTVEVEKSLTEIKIIGNETFKDLNTTSAGLFGIAKQLGVSYKDAADSALEFARQGKGLTESLDASRAALALTRTAGIAATDAVMGLTSAVNAFGRGADAYIEYANKMSAVSDSFAVNNKDLIEGISRSASVAQEAGVSFEQLTALITTLQEKTGRGGAVIGNALKTIFTRVQNPEIIKDLRDLGISVQDATTGSFLPATQIIQNLANEFQGFDKNLRNSILLKVGGGFQVDKLASLLNDVKDAGGTYQRSLGIAMNGSGDILGKVAKLNQTIDSSFTNVLTASKQLGSNIGMIGFSKDFTDILQSGASAITSINEAIFGNGGKDAEDQGSSIGKAVLKGIGSIVSGPGLALFIGILGKLSLDFAKFSTSGLQALLGITSKTKEEQLIQTAITNVLSRNADFQKQIFNLEGNRVAQANLLLGVIRQQVSESKKLEDIARGVSPILQQAGVRLSGGAPQVVGSAKGYIPNLAETIAKEKSESPAGSRIIVDNDFPMGKGQRSTMVYNSNETRIPNFRGSGGDAIIPNYLVNSAKGYTPNFAEPKKNVLNIDARAASIAGITFAGEGASVLDKAKPYPLTPKNLKKYKGSNLLSTLEQYENFNVVNLPVGHAYRFRKGLTGSEDQIKGDFISKLNSKFRSEIVNFLLQEVSDLGLKPGGGLASNLSNIKLDVIGTSTAGYLFEELLKIPTLTDAEKLAQYSGQSATEFFDMKNLEPSFAESYGLPKQKFDFAEIKLGEGELRDGIAKKLLNQTVLEGGGANAKRFGGGGAFKASSGYVPNFATNVSSLRNEMSQKDEKGAYFLKNYYDIGEEGINDTFSGNARIKYFPLDKTLGEYTTVARNELNKVKTTKNYDSFKERLGPYLGSSFNYDSIFTDTSEGILSNVKGALAEKDFANKFKDFKREDSEMAGIDFYKNNEFKANELIEIKARKRQFSQNEANAKVLAFLGSKQIPSLKNKNKDNTTLSNVDFSLYETFKSPNKNKYKNAAGGYIPNFAGGGVIASLKEKAKKIIKSPVTQGLFDQAIETLFGLPEGFEASEIVKQINFALTTSAPDRELAKISRKKKSENRQSKIRDYISRNASSASGGYIPNFASSIEDAIGREKAATGLPDSMIKVSKDSRARNSSLNPTGFIVTNKVDEPRGARDVPNSRMINAYNSSRGFVPNFTIPTRRLDALQVGVTGDPIARQTLLDIQDNSGNASSTTTAVTTAQKKLSEQILEYVKSLGLSDDAQDKIFKSLNSFGQSLNRSEALTETQVRRLTSVGRLSAQQSLGLSNIRNISSTSSSATSAAQAGAQAAAQANTTSTPAAAANNANTPASNAQQESTKKATKSLGDLAQTAFIFQSGLSFATGAISSFGKEAEALGNVLNSVGQIGYTVIQGNDLFKQISKGKSISESIGGAVSGITGRTNSVQALRALGPEGRAIRATELGITGTAVARNTALRSTVAVGAGARTGAAIAGAGGGLAVAGIAAGIVTGGYLIYKALDQIGEFFNGSVKRTENAINAMNAIQQKYAISLNDSQRKIVENFVDASDISTTSLSGKLSSMRIGFGASYRAVKAATGFGDETYKTGIQEELAKAGLDLQAQGTKEFASSLFSLLQPMITNQTGKMVNNVFEPASTKIQGEKLVEILPTYTSKIQKLRNEYKPSDEDIQKYIEKNIEITKPKLIPPSGPGGKPSFAPQPSNEEIKETAIKNLKEQNSLTFALSLLSQELFKTGLEEQALLEQRINGTLTQTELFKKQLELRIQSSKLDSLVPSQLENRLSMEKELLRLNDAQKFSIDLRLKALQEERQTTGEIKNLLLESGKETIFKNLDKTSALGIPEKTSTKINTLFDKAESANGNEILNVYKQINSEMDLGIKLVLDNRKKQEEEIDTLNEILALGGELSEKEKSDLELKQKALDVSYETFAVLKDQLYLFQNRISLIIKESNIRKQQSAQTAQQQAVSQKENFYFTLRKELYSSMFEIQTKALQQRREELSLAKELRDVEFARSEFLNAPNQTESQTQYLSAINSAKETRNSKLEALSQRQSEVGLQNRQSIYNEIASRSPSDIGLLKRASEETNPEKLQSLLEESLIKQGGTFEDKVITAGKAFYDLAQKAGSDFAKGTKGEETYAPEVSISDSSKIIEILKGSNFQAGSKSELQNEINNLIKEGSPEALNKADELQKALTQIEEFSKVRAKALTVNAPDAEKTKKVVDTEFITAKQKAELEKYKKEGFGGGLMTAYDELKKETDSFGNTMGKTIPLSFRDSMASAMKELANPNSTEPLKNRLLGVASSFLQKINDGLMQNLANQITKPLISGVGSFTEGAGMAGAAYASGGYIKGGSGSKDDVPAMLMGGEYVVTKSAVQKYGPAFLDSLNKGTIKKYANGGWVESDVTKYQDPASVNPYGQRRDQGLSFNESGSVIGMDSYTGTAENKQNAMMRAQSDYYAKNAQTGQGGFYMPGENGMGAIMGQRNLLSFATQQTAGTQFDKTSGSGNSASVDLGAGSSNMSLFALRDQGNAKNAAYLESKQKSLDLYFGGIDAAKEKANREEEIRKEQERIKEEAKKQEKAMIKGILTNLAMSAAMAGIGALGNAASKGWSATNQASGGTATFGEKLGGAFTGGTMGGETRGGISNMFSSSGYKDFSIIGSNTGQGLYQWNKKGGYYDEMSPETFGAKYGTASDTGMLKYDKLGTPYMSNQKNMPQPNLRNKGGAPFYDRRAAGGYVAGNGMGDNVPTMLNGGEFVVSKQATQNIGANKLQQINSGKTGGDSSEMIIAKLDELVEKLSAVGTLNITVNSDSKGGQQSKEEGGNQDKQTKELARRIKEVVMVVLKDEKRLGGMLR